jgi:hypothetical protein
VAEAQERLLRIPSRCEDGGMVCGAYRPVDKMLRSLPAGLIAPLKSLLDLHERYGNDNGDALPS